MRMILANVNFQVSPAKPGFGDASCNAPFLLAKRLGKNPREIADDLAKSYSKFTGGLVANASAHPSDILTLKLGKTQSTIKGKNRFAPRTEDEHTKKKGAKTEGRAMLQLS